MTTTKIRVLHLVDDLDVGGLERVVCQCARYLPSDRYQVAVWALGRDGPMADVIRQAGGAVRVLSLRSCYHPAVIRRFIRELRAERPDIVHTHTYFTNTLARLALWAGRCPAAHVAHVHNVYSQYRWHHRVVEKGLSRRSFRIICCSAAVRDFVCRAEGIQPEKTCVIPNGVDVEAFEARPAFDRGALGLAEDDFVVMTVASLTAKKGHAYFVRALRRLCRINARIKYLVVGDGPRRETLHNLVATEGLEDHVVFLGVRSDVPALMGLADVFVLPSLTEGMPLVVMEAMAAGLPVVATNVGGTPELVRDGLTGRLVRPANEDDLVEAVTAIMRDEPLRREYSRQAGILGRGFAARETVRRIERVYREALPVGKGGARAVLYVHNKSRVSGGEQSLLNLWDRLDASRFAAHVCLPGPGPLAEAAERRGVTVHEWAAPSLRWRHVGAGIRAWWRLRRLIQRHRIAVVHSYTPRNNLLSVLAAWGLGVPVVWHERNLLYGAEQDISRRFFRWPRRIICNSWAVAERFYGLPRREQKVRVIHNGVNLNRFSVGETSKATRQTKRAEWGWEDKPVVGLVSNWHPRKRPAYFLRLAARLKHEMPEARFVIVGGEFSDDGTEAGEGLKREAERLGLKAWPRGPLVWTGFVWDVEAYLQAMDVMVHVTRREACSRAILEAMACGVPVVAMREGGNPELIEEGISGHLVDPHDLEGLTRRVAGLLRDPARRQRMGRQARQRVRRHFDVRNQAKRTETVYNELVVSRMWGGSGR